MQAGDTVYIREGTYTDYDERIIPTNSGIKGNYITYTNYRSERVVLRGSETRRFNAAFWLNGKDYIKIDGLVFDGVSGGNELTYNFHLQSDSPCIDAGTWLTYTTSLGSGNQIPMEDVSYFIDGDLIQLEGQIQTARITNVNYDTNIITVNRTLTWSNGQGVSLQYSGNSPDIGAFEFDSGGIPPPPPPEPVPGDINNDGVADVNDLILVAFDFGKTIGFNQDADTNNDDVIDIFDVVFVASRMT